ncbi:hypothetical protein V5O48_006084 [Marasmius crinis-equi]|uniref:PLP-dependent transferase n=1 Tax=Marasmius crinis-equi TaxID=585013 RepID=A0ABR3FKG1_9AGAR
MDIFPSDEKISRKKYNTMGSWFLGPRGENRDLMTRKFAGIVERVCEGRKKYFPSDPVSLSSSFSRFSFIELNIVALLKNFITNEMRTSSDFIEGEEAIDRALNGMIEGLADHSVPFFSPRYAGHMSFDVSLPAVLGYLAAMQYNQNNVTPEASPFSSAIEYQTGQDLCSMLGYNISKPDTSKPDALPVAWGHITCGGSIANLEAMWVARNLKYYPLSLHNAMTKPNALEPPPLDFAAKSFTVPLSNGDYKLFSLCTPWELLNLTPAVVVELPERLTEKYGISREKLDGILASYSIQTVGMERLNSDFGIKEAPQFLIGRANHYSWPKGAAILGVGRENMCELPVNSDARLDIEALEAALEDRIKPGCERALYAVVAIIGTTEHGSVDNLDEIIRLRDLYQGKGLSFMIHADAAWGGYFASKMVAPPPKGKVPISFPLPEYAFSIPLSEHTNDQLLKLRDADSITIDPHKSGYCPYPAGGLCYRDGRFRFLTTWTSPYINATSDDNNSMGIYGVEGSKPGAAPVGVCMSLQVLKTQGYADLLGTAMLTGTKMYARWATATLDSKSLLIVPFNRLPSERKPEGGSGSSEVCSERRGADFDRPEVVDERRHILKTIVERTNSELQKDEDALSLMRKLGSDLMINAFACNFYIGDNLNTDVVEASFLNQRLYKRLSITSTEDLPNEKPIIIMGTEFSQEKYGEALTLYKKRLGLSGKEDLYALSNVSMSPWPTANSFLKTIIDAFKEVAEEEIKTCLVRVRELPVMHSFVIHGINDLFLVYISSFNVESYRRQIIVKAKLSDTEKKKLDEARQQKPDEIFTFHIGSQSLSDVMKQEEWKGDIYQGLPAIYGRAPLLSKVTFDREKIVVDQSLRRSDLNESYPQGGMPFYLFGTSAETHIDHHLVLSPNVHLTASQVRFDPRPEKPFEELMIATLDEQREDIMQPFSANHKPAFFAPNAKLKVSVYPFSVPPNTSSLAPSYHGTITLPAEKGKFFVDYKYINLPAATEIHISSPAAGSSDHLDSVATRVVDLFNQQSKQKITWDDNVVKSIYRLCPDAKDLEVTLGQPASPPHPENSRVLSRFLGPREGANRSLMQELGLDQTLQKLQPLLSGPATDIV